MSNGNKPRSSTGKTAKSARMVRTARRREELRRNLPKPTFDLRSFVQQPEFINTALVTLGFMVVLSLLVIWSRQELKVQVGQVMTDTRLKRVDYSVPNLQKTEAERDKARDSAPQIYKLNTTYLNLLAGSLNGLPKAVAGKASIDAIAPDLRQEYQLTESGLQALDDFAPGGETTPQWQTWVDNLVREHLPANPLIKSDQFQKYWVDREYSDTLKRMLSRGPDDLQEIPRYTRAIELVPERADELRPRLEEIALRAGFPPEVVPYIAAKIAHDAQPTIEYDEAATEERAEQAAAAVAVVEDVHKKGEVIYRRGDVLTADQLTQLTTEAEQFAAHGSFAARWLPRLGVIGLMAILATFMVGYMVLFYPRIARNPTRVLAVCGLIAAMLALTAIVGHESPSLIYLAAVAPTIFVAIVALLAYDQRIALFLGAIQCTLATLALEQRIGMFLILFAGCGVAIAQLREMRHRSTLIKASAITAGVLAVATVLLGLLEMPLANGAWRQILFHGFWAGFGAFAVGFVVLGILPTLERWFDITTGMTLAELRDPKQPLLKQLQQKAPGTYNHSLQVANIAEASADAIGANSLLVYVGSLYHDIGKMNKPQYFVENQTEGPNRHEKLSPAMSLLVIVGHVKDGIELAREYSLPRPIQHFIESHHGTTLVEYFYHAAKTRNGEDVEEIEFRYPGPKPRTKEAAILMLADAVESATRTLADPNPSRIENLVRKISRKRLADGQYDRCDLTFRELGLIEEAAIKSLNAIYHGRISYPSQKQKEAEAAVAPPSAAEEEPTPAKTASA
jgi:putative nucleotidyltransferase with HDIG domain